MPVAINPPVLNINAPNSFLESTGWILPLLKGIGIFFVIGIIVLLLTLGLVFLIKALKPKPTPQHNVMFNKSKSCVATKREDVKYVYRYDTNGMYKIGDYLGETTEIIEEKEVLTVYVGQPKVLGFLPRAIHNFFWRINYLYMLPTSSVKYLTVDKDNALVMLTSTFKYDGQLKVYVASDHIGLPKKVVQLFVKDIDTEFFHEFVQTTQKVMNRAIEVNPYVSAELKRKKEMEEKETD